MVYNREGYAPWSLTRKAGVQSATVDGDIEVPQYIQPILDTGFVDFKGDWKGRVSSDEQFIALDTHTAVANNGEMLTPQALSDNKWPLDMTGYSDLFFAMKPTRGGTYSLIAVMGPDSNSFANLRPVDPAATLYIVPDQTNDFEQAFSDGNQTMSANVWNIFQIRGRLSNQKLLQFKVTNESGGETTVEYAFMRLV